MNPPLPLPLFRRLGFSENPFGERDLPERMHLAQPWLPLAQMHAALQRPGTLVVLYGPQGYGKSSHLQAYRHHFAPEAPWLKLHQHSRPPAVSAPVVLVDDLDHLGPLALARWLTQPGLRLCRVLAAAHGSYRWVAQAVGWQVVNIKLTPPPPHWWHHYLQARLQAAHPSSAPPLPPQELVHALRQRHGHHLRALEWDLYDYYQQAAG